MSEKVCSFEACDRFARKTRKDGLCSAHAEQKRLGRSLSNLPRKRGSRLGATCEFEGCDRNKVLARGLCSGHYYQLKYKEKLEPLEREQRWSQGKECNFSGCKNLSRSKSLCSAHYRQLRVRGSIDLLSPIKVVKGWTYHDGYIRLLGKWEHPNANKRGHILEHTLVMSELLGRPLVKGENVHHRNGVRDDNTTDGPLKTDPETGRLYSGNLELWSTSQPSGQRIGDKVKHAREVLKLYGHLFPEEEADD